MTGTARHALSSVMAALTDVAAWRDCREFSGAGDPITWSVGDGQEAIEVLYARGLYPWTSDDAHAFLFEFAENAMRTIAAQQMRALYESMVGLSLLRATPILDVVSVASLGVHELQRIVGVTGEFMRASPRVTWRVLLAKEYADTVETHRRRTRTANPRDICDVYSSENARRSEPDRFGGAPAWCEKCPWDSSEAQAAWPGLRALAHRGDDPSGILLLGTLGADSVTLGIESVVVGR